jgi:UDP-N-acetylmuramoyl-tripeptide--D-alanyl-D-alanine ligase
MKHSLILILRWILKKLAQLTIWRYRPAVIAVTGSVGKTSAKLAIAAVIAADRPVRYSRSNFNNELGAPLTILGDYERIAGLFFWPKVIFRAIYNLIVPGDYPEILVLEYGVDRPGDMKYLVSIARPNISVLTAIGEVPPHVEFFDSPDALAREKARIIECLPAASFAILNCDSSIVMGLRERTRARVVSYGFAGDADVQLTDFEHIAQGGRPIGSRFSIKYAGTAAPIELPGVFGRANAYALGAAAAIGLVFGMPLQKIASALASYKPAGARMELVPGQKDTLLLNDAYNASPLSMLAALETLHSLPAKRKVAVLGDMLEIGAYAMRAHEAVGAQAAKAAQVLVTVGPRAKFIAEGARKARMRKNMIYSFETAEEAVMAVQDILKKGDLVLVKGSHSIRLEELVRQIKAQ